MTHTVRFVSPHFSLHHPGTALNQRRRAKHHPFHRVHRSHLQRRPRILPDIVFANQSEKIIAHLSSVCEINHATMYAEKKVINHVLHMLLQAIPAFPKVDHQVRMMP